MNKTSSQPETEQQPSEAAVAVQRVVVPPPGEYVDIDTEEDVKYPLRVCDLWLSEQEAVDMVKELQAAIDYLNARRHNAGTHTRRTRRR